MRVYISGPLTDVPNHKELKQFYEMIGEVCSELNHAPYIPHLRGTDPINNPDTTPGEVFDRDKRAVEDSDLIIAYVGVKSIGVGMELSYAEMRKTPIILVYEDNKTISKFPRGIPTIIAEIKFPSYDNGSALSQIRSTLMNMVTTDTKDKSIGYEEIFIEVTSPPNSSTNHIIITDRATNTISEKDLPLGENYIRELLQQLSDQGVNPQKIYVEHFSKISELVKSVWQDANILYSYR